MDNQYILIYVRYWMNTIKMFVNLLIGLLLVSIVELKTNVTRHAVSNGMSISDIYVINIMVNESDYNINYALCAADLLSLPFRNLLCQP